jgi:chromosome segregation ATPase
MEIRTELERVHCEEVAQSKSREESHLSEISLLKTTISSLESQVEQRTASLHSIEIKLEAAQKLSNEKGISVLEAKIKSLQDDLAHRESIVAKQSVELNEANEAKRNAINEIKNAKVTEKENEITALKGEIETLSTEVESLKGEIGKLKLQVVDLTKSHKEANTTVLTLQEELIKVGKEIVVKEEQTLAIRLEAESKTDLLAKADAEVAEIKNRLDIMSKEHEDLIAQRNAYKSRADSLARNLKKHVAVTKTSDELENVRAERDVLKNALEKTKNELTTLVTSPRTESVSATEAAKSKALSAFTSVVGSFAQPSASPDMKMQNVELQKLANRLSDIITDKDLAIVQMRGTAKILAARIKELEKMIDTLTDAADGSSQADGSSVSGELSERGDSMEVMSP